MKSLFALGKLFILPKNSLSNTGEKYLPKNTEQLFILVKFVYKAAI